jgi:hypothetical protein
MRKDNTVKRQDSRFEAGARGGCEAHLFEFQEQSAAEPEPEPEPRTVRIAAIKLDEALSYLRWHAPDFQIERVQNLGLILMVSGSPVD